MELTIEKESVVTQSIALVGNPNVGKSVVFGKLTGRYVTVSNYPGTTVDVARGSGWFLGSQMEVIDTPGILSLFPKSEDERVTRDLLLREKPKFVIQVADAKNLKRSLLITLELAELQIPMILALNMADEARERGIEIDVARLSKMLGIPVLETVAITGEGMGDLRKQVSHAAVPAIQTKYLSEIESAIEDLSQDLPSGNNRFVAETLLYKDPSVWIPLQEVLSPSISFEQISKMKDRSLKKSEEILKRFIRPVTLLALNSRQQKASEIVGEVTQVTGKIESTWAQVFGNLSMRPWPGYLIVLLVLFVMYEFVGVFGAQFLVRLFEEDLFNKILNPAMTQLVQIIIPIQFIQEMIVGRYGLFTMAITYSLALIFPIVTCFFFFFGILEDSGYLPRLAVMLDRAFRIMGLNGKAVLPMILGLGCDTMATLTTRVLDTKKEKVIVALLLTLSVPCSAQLGAMLGMIVGLSWKVFALWFGVIVGTMIAVGWGAAKILPGIRSPFLMEIPPIRKPQLRNLYKKIRARLVWYIKEAVPMFLLGTWILFLSDKIGLLDVIKKLGNPIVVQFLGLPSKATESFIIGFLRRDYGAAGFFMMAQNKLMTPEQIAVALVVITLFMPCIAQFFVTIKERGLKTTLLIAGFVMGYALLIGGAVHWILQLGNIKL